MSKEERRRALRELIEGYTAVDYNEYYGWLMVSDRHIDILIEEIEKATGIHADE